MTPEQVERVQSSFSKVEPIAEQAAGMFYDRLFEQNPELRALFGDNMRRQGLMLMQALSLAVKNLHQPDAIMEPLQAMGRRHLVYGVKREHYPMVGSALLWTLEQGLGDDFDADTREAWAQAYDLLATVMCEAAEHTPQTASADG